MSAVLTRGAFERGVLTGCGNGGCGGDYPPCGACDVLLAHDAALRAERDALREALMEIQSCMGGADGQNGWDAPEDVWAIAAAALRGKT